jgi:hypothetical protein
MHDHKLATAVMHDHKLATAVMHCPSVCYCGHALLLILLVLLPLLVLLLVLPILRSCTIMPLLLRVMHHHASTAAGHARSYSVYCYHARVMRPSTAVVQFSYALRYRARPIANASRTSVGHLAYAPRTQCNQLASASRTNVVRKY